MVAREDSRPVDTLGHLDSSGRSLPDVLLHLPESLYRLGGDGFRPVCQGPVGCLREQGSESLRRETPRLDIAINPTFLGSGCPVGVELRVDTLSPAPHESSRHGRRGRPCPRLGVASCSRLGPD